MARVEREQQPSCPEDRAISPEVARHRGKILAALEKFVEASAGGRFLQGNQPLEDYILQLDPREIEIAGYTAKLSQNPYFPNEKWAREWITFWVSRGPRSRNRRALPQIDPQGYFKLQATLEGASVEISSNLESGLEIETKTKGSIENGQWHPLREENLVCCSGGIFLARVTVYGSEQEVCVNYGDGKTGGLLLPRSAIAIRSESVMRRFPGPEIKPVSALIIEQAETLAWTTEEQAFLLAEQFTDCFDCSSFLQKHVGEVLGSLERFTQVAKTVSHPVSHP